MNQSSRLSEDEQTQAGEKLALDLGLKRDPEHSDRYILLSGTKTAKGLYKTLYRFIHEFEQAGNHYSPDSEE